ncbi:MAG: primosomal protein N' [Clostridia bacterium]|nr:primosomal protein N' [Clostridia bacterium]
MIAEVIVNSSVNKLNKTFDYEVPEGINAKIGMRVLVPFSNRKKLEIGYIIGLKETTDYKCKPISKIVDEVFDEYKFEIIKWMANRYFCNISDVLKLFTPPGTGNNLDKVKIKTEKWVELCDGVDVESIKSDKQKRIVEFLLDNKEAPVSEVLMFTDTTSAVMKTLEKNQIVSFFESEVQRDPFLHKVVERTQKLSLTDEQDKVFKSIVTNKFDEYLLYGVTGSGKTEIYLQAIEKVLNENKTAIVLVPEISLTPQITDRFLSRFGNVVAILHSRLSIGERYDEWRKIKNGDVKIVIGARSAIFAPLQNVGIIIIDEEHDSSYKSETTPKYDVREVARRIAKNYNSPLVLGSATPDIRTYYRALNGEIKLLKLSERISKCGLPNAEILDLRDELARGNKSVFSKKLYDEINENLKNKEQTILFLNRRGYSTFIMCRDCGYVVKCDKCDVAMTYHLTKNKLLCHYCGAEHQNVAICPECKSENIRYFGTGTQKIEAAINKIFPEATVLRMDVDTTRTKNAHENILNKFKNEKVDILLGTQMITKGHDFEDVTLVGVLAADSSINISDYRANERTYQLLTQAIGRAGRGEKAGRAIIQTYSPDEFSIQMAQKQDYEQFYNIEINMREKLNYPPFCDIIIGVLSGPNETEVETSANRLFELLKPFFEIYRPVPAPISKINDNYRWRLLIKTKANDENIEILRECLAKFEKIKNDNVNLNLDINPNNMM